MKIGLRLSLVFAASLCLLGGVIPIKANENTKIRVDSFERKWCELYSCQSME